MTFCIETDNRILNATSKENGRYSMSAPRVRIKDGRGVVCATDGRIASVRPIQVLNGTPENCSAALGVETLGKNPTKNPKAYRATIEPSATWFKAEDGKITIGEDNEIRSDELDRRGSVKATRIGKGEDGTFPPISDVFPSRTSHRYATITICYDTGEPGPAASADKPFVCVGHGQDAGASIGMHIIMDGDSANGKRKTPEERRANAESVYDRGSELFKATS